MAIPAPAGTDQFPGLTERLYDAGAQFSSEIVEQGSPVLSFLLWFVLPILLFSFIGNQMNKKLMEKAGGGPGSMMFGSAGKSNAKVYVQSTHGIRFADVAGAGIGQGGLDHVRQDAVAVNGAADVAALGGGVDGGGGDVPGGHLQPVITVI